MVLLKFRLTCLTLHRPVSVSIEIKDYYLEQNFSLSLVFGLTFDFDRLYPLLWRFLPAVDPQVCELSYLLFVLGKKTNFSTRSQILKLINKLRQVDLFHSRDLDSRLSSREVAAVQEFLPSVAQVVTVTIITVISSSSS